jgi:hypothetical protein
MTQANRVHSTPPTNTPIDTTRRGFLGGTAAALAAGTAVNVAALATIRPALASLPDDSALLALEGYPSAGSPFFRPIVVSISRCAITEANSSIE